jgi:hypothetical protein
MRYAASLRREREGVGLRPSLLVLASDTILKESTAEIK